MTVLKQCDLKTAEWNKFYASFLTEVSGLEVTATDEKHLYRGTQKVRAKSTRQLAAKNS
jgi:hypothetical protein